MTETLEEAAERKFENIGDRLIFEDGAKWQQERMYSEEEVLTLLNKHHNAVLSKEYDDGVLNDKEWFEQFKKK